MKILAKIKNIKVGTFGARNFGNFVFYFTEAKCRLIKKKLIFEKCGKLYGFDTCVFMCDGNLYLREWLEFIKIIEN
jgi:hypothetical protein